MSDKSKLLKAFNTHFFEFIDDIIHILPDNVDILSSKTLFEMTKKANPTLLAKLWQQYVFIPYNEELSKDNLDYFIDKDYSNDVVNLHNSQDVLSAIDNLRQEIRTMSGENKKHCLKYLQNLNKLSLAYSSS